MIISRSRLPGAAGMDAIVEATMIAKTSIKGSLPRGRERMERDLQV